MFLYLHFGYLHLATYSVNAGKPLSYMAALRRISQRKDGTILVYSWILQGDVSFITSFINGCKGSDPSSSFSSPWGGGGGCT